MKLNGTVPIYILQAFTCKFENKPLFFFLQEIFEAFLHVTTNVSLLSLCGFFFFALFYFVVFVSHCSVLSFFFFWEKDTLPHVTLRICSCGTEEGTQCISLGKLQSENSIHV